MNNEFRGIIPWFAKNPVAANLLLLLYHRAWSHADGQHAKGGLSESFARQPDHLRHVRQRGRPSSPKRGWRSRSKTSLRTSWASSPSPALPRGRGAHRDRGKAGRLRLGRAVKGRQDQDRRYLHLSGRRRQSGGGKGGTGGTRPLAPDLRRQGPPHPPAAGRRTQGRPAEPFRRQPGQHFGVARPHDGGGDRRRAAPGLRAFPVRRGIGHQRGIFQHAGRRAAQRDTVFAAQGVGAIIPEGGVRVHTASDVCGRKPVAAGRHRRRAGHLRRRQSRAVAATTGIPASPWK